MKARALKTALNNTGYIVAEYRKYIGIGSPYVHNLISVNKETFEIKYALDTFHKGRAAISNKELEFIWDKLHEMVESGEINFYLEGEDEVDKNSLLKVYTYSSKNGDVIEDYSEEVGWPNITINGKLQHSNTYFASAEEARSAGIKEVEAELDFYKTKLSDMDKERKKLNNEIDRAFKALEKLENYQP